MSIPNMVADEREADKLFKFNPKDVKTWVKEFRIHMMTKRRNHLGLRPHGLVRPAAGGQQAAQDYQDKLEAWKERNDTCVAVIYHSCKSDSDAIEIIDQYIQEKDALPDGDPNKEPVAHEMIERLVDRFEGEQEDEIGELSAQFTNFVFDPL